MHEINKERFGAFVASRRKALGLTQTQLAEQVCVSNKAVSKWETGVSLPDVTILIPLAETLGVTVTELLEGRQIEQKTALDPHRVEELVQSVIRYPESERFENSKDQRKAIFLSCLLIAAVEALLLHLFILPIGSWTVCLDLTYIFGIVFGWYFFLLVKPLPPYHDQYRISGMHQGFLRMNIPGLYFNNRNWPHIVRVGQIWSMCCLVGYPLVFSLMTWLLPGFWTLAETSIATSVLLLGLFVPMFVVGKKYE